MPKHIATHITRIPIVWTIYRVYVPGRYSRRGTSGARCSVTTRRLAKPRRGPARNDCKEAEDRCIACETSLDYREPGRVGCQETVRRESPMIKFLQINMKANWSEEQLTAQTVDEIEANVLIVSEPPTRYGREDRWCFSSDRKL